MHGRPVPSRKMSRMHANTKTWISHLKKLKDFMVDSVAPQAQPKCTLCIKATNRGRAKRRLFAQFWSQICPAIALHDHFSNVIKIHEICFNNWFKVRAFAENRSLKSFTSNAHGSSPIALTQLPYTAQALLPLSPTDDATHTPTGGSLPQNRMSPLLETGAYGRRLTVNE